MFGTTTKSNFGSQKGMSRYFSTTDSEATAASKTIFKVSFVLKHNRLGMTRCKFTSDKNLSAKRQRQELFGWNCEVLKQRVGFDFRTIPG
jgi:hypothetical protein